MADRKIFQWAAGAFGASGIATWVAGWANLLPSPQAIAVGPFEFDPRDASGALFALMLTFLVAPRLTQWFKRDQAGAATSNTSRANAAATAQTNQTFFIGSEPNSGKNEALIEMHRIGMKAAFLEVATEDVRTMIKAVKGLRSSFTEEDDKQLYVHSKKKQLADFCENLELAHERVWFVKESAKSDGIRKKRELMQKHHGRLEQLRKRLFKRKLFSSISDENDESEALQREYTTLFEDIGTELNDFATALEKLNADCVREIDLSKHIDESQRIAKKNEYPIGKNEINV